MFVNLYSNSVFANILFPGFSIIGNKEVYSQNTKRIQKLWNQSARYMLISYIFANSKMYTHKIRDGEWMS